MLASLRLVKDRQLNVELSDEDDLEISSAEKGTLGTGQIALEKITSSRFDSRDCAKLEFLNLYHTFKNFRINAKKTQHDSLFDYLQLMLAVLNHL